VGVGVCACVGLAWVCVRVRRACGSNLHLRLPVFWTVISTVCCTGMCACVVCVLCLQYRRHVRTLACFFLHAYLCFALTHLKVKTTCKMMRKPIALTAIAHAAPTLQAHSPPHTHKNAHTYIHTQIHAHTSIHTPCMRTHAQASSGVSTLKNSAPPSSILLGPAAEAARQEAWAVYGERWADKVCVCVCGKQVQSFWKSAQSYRFRSKVHTGTAGTKVTHMLLGLGHCKAWAVDQGPRADVHATVRKAFPRTERVLLSEEITASGSSGKYIRYFHAYACI
jgi:hypothetical protein